MEWVYFWLNSIFNLTYTLLLLSFSPFITFTQCTIFNSKFFSQFSRVFLIWANWIALPIFCTNISSKKNFFSRVYSGHRGSIHPKLMKGVNKGMIRIVIQLYLIKILNLTLILSYHLLWMLRNHTCYLYSKIHTTLTRIYLFFYHSNWKFILPFYIY